jgi:hypothetical protein
VSREWNLKRDRAQTRHGYRENMTRQPANLPLVRSEENQLILDLGLKALHRINADKTWDDWMSVGAALRVITEAAVDQAKSGPWHRDNKSAVRMFNGLWEHYEHSDGSNHKPLSSSERTQLRFVMDHPEVEVWRGTLDSTKRRSLNHPNAVVSAWRKATQTPDKEATRAAQAKADVMVELEKELADMRKQLQQAKRDNEWNAPDNLSKAEDAMVAQLKSAGIANKIESAKRLLSRLGITDINKLLAPRPRRKRLRR